VEDRNELEIFIIFTVIDGFNYLKMIGRSQIISCFEGFEGKNLRNKE